MVFICANNAVSALNHSMLKFLSPIPATDSVVSGLTRLSIAVSAALFFSTIAPSAAAEVFTVEAGKAGVLFGNDTRSEYDDYQKIKDGDDFSYSAIDLSQATGKNISIFGFSIAYYGIVIVTGMMIAIWIAQREAKRTGQNPEQYLDLAMIGIAAGILGARIYYVIFAWDYYKDDLLSIFNIRQGGLAIYGGIIGACIAVVIYSRKKKQNFSLLMDTASMSIVFGQIMGRWGNFFNREAFGDYTNNLFAMQLPVSAVRANEITQKMWDHVVTVNGVEYIQVHPTFLYESLWNVGVLLFLFWFRKRKKFNGEVFLMYLIGYGLGRIWIEGLRTDQLLLPVVGLPVSQLLSGCLVVGCTILVVWKRKKLSSGGETAHS